MTQQTAHTTVTDRSPKRKAVDVDEALWEDFRVAALRRKYPTASKALEAALRHWLEHGGINAAA